MEKLREKFKEIYNGDNLEEALQAIKNMGASQIQSLNIIKVELNKSIAEADQIILNSITWSNEKENTIDFRKDFTRFLDEQSDE